MKNSNGNDNNTSTNYIDLNKHLKYNFANNKEGDGKMVTAEKQENMITIRYDGDEWVSPNKAAGLLRIGSVNNVKRLIENGRLEAKRFDGKWIRISMRSIKSLIDHKDDELKGMQKFIRLLDEIDEVGRELSPEEMDDLSMRQVGTLPWEKEEKDI